MAFIFSTSHLPDLERPAEEEDDDDMKPMPRAGGVRAFSHLPQPVRAQADASSLWGRGVAPLPPRSAAPTSPAPAELRDQDDPPPPEAGLDDAPDSGSQEPEDSSPWHMPRLSAKDLLPQGPEEEVDTAGSKLSGPTLKPWEKPARSSGLDGTLPADRSATSPRNSSFSPSPQDLRDSFQSPAPGSPVGQATAQDSKPALPGGRLFEQRSAPEAFVMQQMGKGASGLSQQQRLLGSERTLAAQQKPVRGANPPAQGSRLAAQQPAAVPAQNVPAKPQPPAAGGAKKPPCAECQAKLDKALLRLCELQAEIYATRAEISKQFKIIQEADDDWWAAYRRGNDAAGIAAILKQAHANTIAQRLQNSLFTPESEKISIQKDIDALRSCIHSNPFEQQ